MNQLILETYKSIIKFLLPYWRTTKDLLALSSLWKIAKKPLEKLSRDKDKINVTENIDGRIIEKTDSRIIKGINIEKVYINKPYNDEDQNEPECSYMDTIISFFKGLICWYVAVGEVYILAVLGKYVPKLQPLTHAFLEASTEMYRITPLVVLLLGIRTASMALEKTEYAQQ